ncbi:hypothetical protein [Pseudocitrobacter faecalis]|uniref:Uncharacterized protein n=1 Tax=Pseudocitrobacter faecalis TaxID=1398493 RepID=A0ABX9G0I0_9ENTR|nr:hypothetical protein DFQ50_102210 [Pseudocitrobacter faecalis]
MLLFVLFFLYNIVSGHGQITTPMPYLQNDGERYLIPEIMDGKMKGSENRTAHPRAALFFTALFREFPRVN